jgi:predicted Zn-dependent peptidase
MGYHIPAIGTPDYYAVSMLSKILADGESSRLVKRLVNDEQKALYAGSFPFPLEHPGLNIIFAVASMESAPEELEKIINDEIKKLQNELISDEELLKLKNKIEADFVSKISSMEGIAEKLADYKVIYGDANLINTEIDRYLKVTKEDIRNAAKKYFTPQNRVVLYYLPDNTNENKQ